jgi:hypothetical protein
MELRPDVNLPIARALLGFQTPSGEFFYSGGSARSNGDDRLVGAYLYQQGRYVWHACS